MGALVSKAMRPIKSFNIENRAHRVISKEKPTPAPKYPHNIEDLKRTLEANPDIDDKLDKKDEGLDDRLKNVYVTAHGRPEDDVTREIKSENRSKRALPQDRKMQEEYEFGFKEPDRVTYGRTTLRDAINFISAHQANPNEVTASKIALEYKLKLEDVESTLKYFKTYEVYIPETAQSPAIFAGPAQMRKGLYKLGTKELEEKKEEPYVAATNTEVKRPKENIADTKDATFSMDNTNNSTITMADTKNATVNMAKTENPAVTMEDTKNATILEEDTKNAAETTAQKNRATTRSKSDEKIKETS